MRGLYRSPPIFFFINYNISNFLWNQKYNRVLYYSIVFKPFFSVDHILGALENSQVWMILWPTLLEATESCNLQLFHKMCFYEYYYYTHVCHDSHTTSFVSEMCTTECSPHGVCVGGVCRCAEGWSGTRCEQELCQCGEHGVCRKGKCECHQGWTGENCNIGEWRYKFRIKHIVNI